MRHALAFGVAGPPRNLEEDSYSSVVAAKSLMATSESAPDLWRALPGVLSKPAIIHKCLHAGCVFI